MSPARAGYTDFVLGVLVLGRRLFISLEKLHETLETQIFLRNRPAVEMLAVVDFRGTIRTVVQVIALEDTGHIRSRVKFLGRKNQLGFSAIKSIFAAYTGHFNRGICGGTPAITSAKTPRTVDFMRWNIRITGTSSQMSRHAY